MFKCLRCHVAERKFLICFGVLYVMSVVTLLHKTSVILSLRRIDSLNSSLRIFIGSHNASHHGTPLPSHNRIPHHSSPRHPPAANLTSGKESGGDIIEAEEVTLRRKARLPSLSEETGNTTLSKRMGEKWNKQRIGMEALAEAAAEAKKEKTAPPTAAAVVADNSSGKIVKLHVRGVVDKNLSCQKLPTPVFLPAGIMPLTALHSFPGSGNTWVRVLLASMTGINTGDIYRDGAFAKTPGFSYKKDDTVIAVKTHHPFWDDNNGPDPSAPKGRYWERSVIVVRHPLDATVSVYNWFRMRGSHTKTAPIEKYINKEGRPTKEWNKWAHDQIRNWGRCIDYWINIFKGPKLVVFYEDLVSDLRNQLVLINNFLRVELDERRLECTVESQAQQKFHRKNSIDKKILYDTSMLNEVEIVLAKAQETLMTNYTHTQSGFTIPASYAVKLIKENFSMKPPVNKTEETAPR